MTDRTRNRPPRSITQPPIPAPTAIGEPSQAPQILDQAAAWAAVAQHALDDCLRVENAEEVLAQRRNGPGQ